MLAKMSHIENNTKRTDHFLPRVCACVHACEHACVCVCACVYVCACVHACVCVCEHTCAAVLQQKRVSLLHCVAGPTQLMEVKHTLKMMLVVPPDAPQSLIRMLKITLGLFFCDKVRRAERQRCRTSATVTRLKNNRHNVTGSVCDSLFMLVCELFCRSLFSVLFGFSYSEYFYCCSLCPCDCVDCAFTAFSHQCIYMQSCVQCLAVCVYLCVFLVLLVYGFVLQL